MRRAAFSIAFYLSLIAPALAQGGMMPGPGTPAASAPSCSQSTAYFARVTIPGGNQPAYATLICGLVADGVWAKLDALYVLAAPSQTIAEANLVSSSYTLTPHGTLYFAAGIGWQGDGVAGYLDTGFVPSTAGGNFALNSASLGVVVASEGQFLEGAAEIGSFNTANTGYDYIYPLYTDGNAYASASGVGNASAVSAYGDVVGTWVLSRTGATTETLYRNGASFASGTDPAVTLANLSELLLARRNNGPTIANYSGDTLSAAFLGAGLTSGDVANITTLLSAIAPTLTASQPPPLATYWGFTNTAFSYVPTNTSNIDVNNTQAPGFVWYTADFFTAPPTASADISVAGGVLTINSTNASEPWTANPGAYRSRLLTAGCYGGSTCSTSPGYIGTTFSPGGYYQACFSFDPTVQSGSTSYGWPSFWLQDVAGLLSQTNQTAAQFAEIDTIEQYPTGSGTTEAAISLNDWTNTSGGGFGTLNAFQFHASSAELGNPTFNNSTYHCYGTLWVLTTQNAGTGIFLRYFDGVRIGGADTTYTATGPASPTFQPSNPNGTMFVSESGNFDMMLDGSLNWPINVKSVLVKH